jgi:prephenate dehydrogenase
VGFGKFSITTADEHDRMIAFTSQLAHVVSNAYVKTPTAQNHKGFSAGSYKDLTRVAWLNENMWTELFLENKEPLLYELDYIIASLSEYKIAIENDDADTLRQLLKDGRLAKEKVDG